MYTQQDATVESKGTIQNYDIDVKFWAAKRLNHEESSSIHRKYQLTNYSGYFISILQNGAISQAGSCFSQ